MSGIRGDDEEQPASKRARVSYVSGGSGVKKG